MADAKKDNQINHSAIIIDILMVRCYDGWHYLCALYDAPIAEGKLVETKVIGTIRPIDYVEAKDNPNNIYSSVVVDIAKSIRRLLDADDRRPEMIGIHDVGNRNSDQTDATVLRSKLTDELAKMWGEPPEIKICEVVK